MHQPKHQPMQLRSKRNRKGVAPIEFVMFLPVLVAFMLLTLWIARVQKARQEASLATEAMTRARALQVVNRHELSRSLNLPDPQAPALERLVRGFSSDLPLMAGVVQSTGRVDTGEGVGQDLEPLGDAIEHQLVLSNSWENLLAFPQTQAQQPPLTLPPAVHGLAPGMSDLSAFRSLLSFSGQANPNATNALQQTASGLVQGVSEIGSGINQLATEIAQLQERLLDLRDALRPDWGLINRLQRELNEKRRQLSELNRGKAHGSNASDFGPF